MIARLPARRADCADHAYKIYTQQTHTACDLTKQRRTGTTFDRFFLCCCSCCVSLPQDQKGINWHRIATNRISRIYRHTLRMPDIEDNYLTVCGDGDMARLLWLYTQSDSYSTATQAHREEITGCLMMVDLRV